MTIQKDDSLMLLLTEKVREMELFFAFSLDFDFYKIVSTTMVSVYKFCESSRLSAEYCQKIVGLINDFYLSPFVTFFDDATLFGAAVLQVSFAEKRKTDLASLETVSGVGLEDLQRVTWLLTRVYSAQKWKPEKLFDVFGERMFWSKTVSLTGFLVEQQARENLGWVIRDRGEEAQRGSIQ